MANFGQNGARYTHTKMRYVQNIYSIIM